MVDSETESAILDSVFTASAPNFERSPVNPFAARFIFSNRLTTVSKGLIIFLSSGFCLIISALVFAVKTALEDSSLFSF